MDTEIEYTFKTPFSYTFKGSPVEAVSVILKAPNSKNMTEICGLKQAFYRALPEGKDGAEEKEKKDDTDITADNVMGLLLKADNVEIITVMLHARKLFLSNGIAMVDNQQQLTRPMADDISPDDLEEMVGEYLVNFILASMLQKMKDS